jgi:hypothetical protein
LSDNGQIALIAVADEGESHGLSDFDQVLIDQEDKKSVSENYLAVPM